MTEQILFDKFRILSCIKKDAFSAVYQAEHIFLKKNIFLKSLNTELLPDQAILQRFMREAKTLAHLEHSNIIQVLDFGSWHNFFYISFEYFQSKNLRVLLRQRSISHEQKEDIFAQICLALNYAHNQNVIHRDLKPENILVNEQGLVKIADFGLAIFKDEVGITEASSLVGTPAYMAPEQICGQKSTARSDLFSLGIILFELFSGRNPFLGADAGQTINNILKFKDNSLQDLLQELPQNIQNALNGLLQKDPGNRFKSAMEARGFFPISGGITKDQTDVPTQHQKKRRVLPLILLLIICGVIIYYVRFYDTTKQHTALEDTIVLISEKTPLQKDTVFIKQIPATSDVETHEPKNQEYPIQNNLIAQVPKPSFGELKIECLPWANVRIDSGQAETTPLSGPVRLQSGLHVLSLEHPAYPPYKSTIKIDSAKTTFFKLNLDTLMGYLECRINPWGNVIIDGHSLGQSPFSKPFKVAPGTHRLVVQNAQFSSYEKDIQIVKKDTLRLQIDLLSREHVQN